MTLGWFPAVDFFQGEAFSAPCSQNSCPQPAKPKNPIKVENGQMMTTLPETKGELTPEHLMVGRCNFLLGRPIFKGELLVLGRVFQRGFRIIRIVDGSAIQLLLRLVEIFFNFFYYLCQGLLFESQGS